MLSAANRQGISHCLESGHPENSPDPLPGLVL